MARRLDYLSSAGVWANDLVDTIGAMSVHQKADESLTIATTVAPLPAHEMQAQAYLLVAYDLLYREEVHNHRVDTMNPLVGMVVVQVSHGLAKKQPLECGMRAHVVGQCFGEPPRCSSSHIIMPADTVNWLGAKVGHS